MEDVHAGLGLQNMSDPVLKEIYGIYETKNLTKEQIKKYKMTEREIFKGFDNLSKDELNIKKNKSVYVRNDVMTAIIKNSKGEKKEVKEKQMSSEKELMLPESEISEFPEHEVKSKIGNIFVNEKILEEYSVKINEIDPYFYEHYRKKYKLTKMVANTYYLQSIFILLNIF